jgi:hypothetical protein
MGFHVLGSGCSGASPATVVTPDACPPCPWGTMCLPSYTPVNESCAPGAANPPIGCAIGDTAGTCRLAPTNVGTSALDALVTGFHVPSFALQSTGSTYTWTAPEGVSIVACGLFLCPPLVSNGVISNGDSCLVSEQTYESASGSYTPGVDVQFSGAQYSECHYASDAAADVGDGGIDGGTVRFSSFQTSPITFAAVGCWAFDTSHVVYATPLYFPPASSFPALGGFDPQCQQPTSSACGLPEGGFGTCDNHVCTKRCVFPSDCVKQTTIITELDDAGRLVVVDGGVCPPATCERERFQYIGTCRYPSQTTAPGAGAEGGANVDGADDATSD